MIVIDGTSVQKRKHKLVTCKCDFCEKEFLLSEIRATKQKVHFCDKNCFKQGAKKGGKFDELLRQSNLEKYGVENPSQREDIKQLKKQTCLKNYGVENPNQSHEIRERTKATNIQRYGTENPYKAI